MIMRNNEESVQKHSFSGKKKDYYLMCKTGQGRHFLAMSVNLGFWDRAGENKNTESWK